MIGRQRQAAQTKAYPRHTGAYAVLLDLHLQLAEFRRRIQRIEGFLLRLPPGLRRGVFLLAEKQQQADRQDADGEKRKKIIPVSWVLSGAV